MTIRVLIADDQELVRAGFRKLLDAEDTITVVGEAADGAQAVARATELAPDVVLMDIRMPRLDGIEATRRLIRSTGVQVLVLTTYDLDEYVFSRRCGRGPADSCSKTPRPARSSPASPPSPAATRCSRRR